MDENFLNLGREMNTQIHEAQGTPSRASESEQAYMKTHYN